MVGAFRGLGSIPLDDGTNRGYWYSYNWSLAFPFLIPLLFLCFSNFFVSLQTSITALLDVGVIRPVNPSESSNLYIMRLREYLTRADPVMVILSFFLSAVFNILDIYTAFHTRDEKGYFAEKDWTNAWQLWNPKPVSLWYNVLFDSLAYLAQYVAIALIVLALYKSLLLFYVLLRTLKASFLGFRMVLDFNDPLGSVGISPLGSLVNSYIQAILLASSYYVLIRITHVSRGVMRRFGPFSAFSTGVVAVSILVLLPWLMVRDSFERTKLEEYVRLVRLEQRLEESIPLLSDTGRKAEMASEVKEVREGLVTLDKQSIILLKQEWVYIYGGMFLAVFSLILTPPKRLTDVVRYAMGQRSS